MQINQGVMMRHRLASPKTWCSRGTLFLGIWLAGSLFLARAQNSSPERTVSNPTSTQPVLQRRTPPVYPIHALRHHIEGTVVVLARIGADGAVTAVRAEPTRTDPSLVESALQAVKRWHYAPATDDKGRPITVWIKVPIRFYFDKHQHSGN
ncbi:energy transducer TonB [Oleiagrimonas citrea]|uniref:Energy transducer TonB n=2 Tax=Oleiagrimonas citrea TaxID=1665687 RepID=A0A846ZJE9_9GAMM|nr:energy transducer TonB [Oleiagrimonas citrea]